VSSLQIIQDRSDKISDAERERLQREGDARLIRAMAIAIRRGDHLPKAMREAA
jgi:hypothetical protein